MGTALTELNKQNIRPLIEPNDKLRDLTVGISDINVPSIVAVGDQSHGKTSVIESLCGIELPRGEGIQTRLPLELRLRKFKTDHGHDDEYATIKDHDSEEKCISIDSIADEVRAYTNKLAGDMDVVDSVIKLTVYRKDADDLTLIDLPGMTRVPVKGQSKDIESVITRMYQRYTTPKESILLNVVSCMVDFSTSKSIQMSRELDPEAKRTLLCISKVDQHKESGLYGKIKSTAYGDMELNEANVFCVRNRTQAENDDQVTLVRARELESDFFNENVDLKPLPRTSCGIAGLSARLVTIQYERIQDTLPVVAKKVSDRLGELDKEVEGFGVVLRSENECNRVFESTLHSMLDELVFQYSGHGQSRHETTSHSAETQKAPLCITMTSEKGEQKKTTRLGAVLKFDLFRHQADNDENQSDDDEDQWGNVDEDQWGNVDEDQWDDDEDQPDDDGDQSDNDEDQTELRLAARYPTSVESFKVDVVYAEKGTSMSSGTKNSFSYTAAESNASMILVSDTNLATRDFTVDFEIKEVRFKATEEGKQAEILFDLTTTTTKSDKALLCSEVKAADDAFSKELATKFSTSLFFSEGMFTFIKAEAEKRTGLQGMPGIISSHVALRIMHRLNRGLTGLTDEHVVKVSHLVTKRISDEMKVEFSHLPRLCALLMTIIDDVSAETLRITREKIDEILAYEGQLITCNHYFMDNVQSLRKQIFDDGMQQEAGHKATPVSGGLFGKPAASGGLGAPAASAASTAVKTPAASGGIFGTAAPASFAGFGAHAARAASAAPVANGGFGATSAFGNSKEESVSRGPLATPVSDATPQQQDSEGAPILTEQYIKDVRKMSNDDQRIVDLQIECFAYHKVLMKRLVDYVVLCTRYHLADRPIMQKALGDKLRTAIDKHCEMANTSYFGLMGPSKADQRKLAGLKTLIVALREAQQAVMKAVKSALFIDV